MTTIATDRDDLTSADWETYAAQYQSYVTDLQVMHSTAGYYIGRGLVSFDCPAPGMPYSRNSGYFSSFEVAAHHLALMSQQ